MQTAKVIPMIGGIPVRKRKSELQRLEESLPQCFISETGQESSGGTRLTEQYRQQSEEIVEPPQRNETTVTRSWGVGQASSSKKDPLESQADNPKKKREVKVAYVRPMINGLPVSSQRRQNRIRPTARMHTASHRSIEERQQYLREMEARQQYSREMEARQQYWREMDARRQNLREVEAQQQNLREVEAQLQILREVEVPPDNEMPVMSEAWSLYFDREPIFEVDSLWVYDVFIRL